VLGLLGALALAALVFSRHLTGSLYGDEVGHTYHVVVLGNLWRNLLDPSMCHPPLCFVLAKVAYILVGKLWAIRLPSLLAALGTVLVMALGARRFLGKNYFLPAAWLAACAPFLMEFASEGRAYSLMIFFSAATLFAFMAFVEEETWGRAVLLVAVATLGGFTHFTFWLLLLYLALAYLGIRRRLTARSMFVAGATALFLGPLGVLVFALQHMAFKGYLQVSWIKGYLEPLNFLARLPVAMWLGYSTFSLPQLDPGRNVGMEALQANAVLLALVVVFFCGFLLGCIALLRKRRRWFWFLAGAVAAPPAIGIGASVAGLYLIREKHLAVIWAPLFLLTLMAFGQLKRRRLGWVPIAAYLALVGVSIAHYAVWPNQYTRRMDWAGLRAVLESKLGPADAVVLYQYDFDDHAPGEPPLRTKGATQVSLSARAAKGENPLAAAKSLDGEVKGSVYVVDDETDRLSVDPSNDLLLALRKDRPVQKAMFGRNLVLYEFGPKRFGGGAAP
jgi:4-amino-4-deoxy-L-arabinose transferase-like glycosyltransferase